MTRRSFVLPIWFPALLVAGACSGAIGDEVRQPSPGGAAGGASQGGAGGVPAPPEIGEEDLPRLRDSDGLRPLGRGEYVASVRDLLGVSVDPAKVPLETLVAGHSKIARAQEIVRSEIEAYYQLGLRAAQAAVETLGCMPVTSACAHEFVPGFLRRAFREPIDEPTKMHYLAMLEASEAGSDVKERLITVMTAVLNSPRFLYRSEIGTQVQGRTRTLSEHEIASRLAFLVWEAPPDEALLAAADGGRLASPDERQAQLERLLAAPSSRAGLGAFVADWMGLVDPESRIASKNPEVLQGTPPELEARALSSLAATTDEILGAGSGAFLNLLDTEAYVTEGTLGELLGLGGQGTALSLRSLDPTTRRGILLHPAVLASHTSEGSASPFLVGKFIYENVLCGVLGNIPQIPPLDESDLGGKTLRQRLEDMTAPPPCQTCHAKIGPPGFAFMAYDVLGRHRPTDGNGTPLDTTGTLGLEDQPISFQSAPELSAKLAQHPQAAHCVARRLFRWAFGRFEAEDDRAFVKRLEAQAETDRAQVLTLLRTLVRSDEFTHVRQETP